MELCQCVGVWECVGVCGSVWECVGASFHSRLPACVNQHEEIKYSSPAFSESPPDSISRLLTLFLFSLLLSNQVAPDVAAALQKQIY